jgi:DNA-binding transcriptional ArsR family regulator
MNNAEKCVEGEIHFRDFPPTIAVKLVDELRSEMLDRIIKQFGGSRNLALALINSNVMPGWKTESLASWIRRMKQENLSKESECIPIKMIIWIADKLGLSLNKIEEKILAYKVIHGRTIACSPKIPILITPEFDSLYANLRFNGSVKRTQRGHGEYIQYTEISKLRVYQKIVNVFGDIKPLRRENLIRKKGVDIPAFLTDIFKQYYGPRTFSKRAGLPYLLKTRPRMFKIAIISTALVDEGTICDEIVLRLSNKKLLDDLWEIAKSLGYRCSKVRRVKDVYKFTISLFDAQRLLEDIRELTKYFPTLDLAHKQRHLNYIVQRQKLRGERPREIRHEILMALRKGKTTVRELSIHLQMEYRNIAKYLRKLEQAGLVKRCGKKGSATVWFLLRRSEKSTLTH